MKIELNDIGTDVEIQWDMKGKDKLYLNTTLSCFQAHDGEFLSSGSFYLTMPIETAEALLEKLTALIGKEA